MVNFEKDLSAVLDSFFVNYGKDKGAMEVKELAEYFEEALRSNRNKIDVASEIVITHAFMDAKPEV